MADLTPDQNLALAYVPAPRRQAVRVLWELDATLAHAALIGREPMIRRIKLAWWREALERLDIAPPPAEPMLQDIARHLLPPGVTGADLAGLEEDWALAGEAGGASPEYGARGRTLFALTGRILGSTLDAQQQAAGESWAWVDLARRIGADPRPHAGRIPRLRWPPILRPLGMLAVLAEGDAANGFSPQGSPRRMLRMLRHRLTGR